MIETPSPGWKAYATPALALLVVVQFAVVAMMWNSSRKTNQRVAELEEQVGELEEATEMAASAEDLAYQVEELDEEVENLRAMSLYASGKLKRLGLQMEDLDTIESDLTDMFPGIDSMIEQKVATKVAETNAPKVNRLPTIDSLSESLGLNPYQEQKSKEIYEKTKFDAFNIVNTPRADGTTLLSELTDVMMTSDDPKKDGNRVMMKLYYENVPGTDVTYFTQLKQLQANAEGDIGDVLTEQQSSSYDSMGINVFGVQTGYNPLADYLRSYNAQGN